MRNSNSSRTGLEIAVIGISGRFPGAQNVQEYWQNLQRGRETIARFTEEELAPQVSEERYTRKNYVKAKGYLNNIEYFDAEFFGYNPKEASQLSPQSRVFQECVWEALEDAGYDIQRFRGSVGVYAGASSSLVWQLLTSVDSSSGLDIFSSALLNDKDYLSTRVSYQLNLKGPSVTINTACSTSLVAIHMACRALLTHECDMALAGGVTVTLPIKSGYLYENGMIHSPDGHCRPFDKGANGTVFSDGAGVVLLKPLAQALEDNDHIHAVILGSAINNDGKAKVGFTAPSTAGQAEVIKRAYKVSKTSPESISYLETHGTGTSLGDPIEIEALKAAFKNNESILLGSVKSNIGHLDAAAGVASLLKVVMALKHRQLPATLHFSELNHKIKLSGTGFSVNGDLTAWETETVRRAGINSFGIGGTNAHVIVEEAPGVAVASESQREEGLMLFSAKTEKSLIDYLTKIKEHLAEENYPLADVSYTQNFGRTWFNQRAALHFLNRTNLEKKLTQLLDKKNFTEAKARQKVLFAFGGIGAEYPQMGADLYREVELFREVVEETEAALGHQILHPLYEAPPSVSQQYLEENKEIILFCFEYALGKFFMQLGLQPFFMIGHGVGEYVSATLSGVLSLPDAHKILEERKKINNAHQAPTLLSIQSRLAEVTSHLNGHNIAIAACNAEFNTVVSGASDDLLTFKQELASLGIRSAVVPNTQVFNTSAIDLSRREDWLNTITFNEPRIPYISCVTGEKVDGQIVRSKEYWQNLMTKPIRFDRGINELLKYENAIFLELGPSMVISSWINRNKRRFPNQSAHHTIKNQHERISDLAKLNEVLGELWKKGVSVKLDQLEHCTRGKRVPLPTYPFDRKRIWVEKEYLDTSNLGPKPRSSEEAKEQVFTRKEIEKKLRQIWGQVVNDPAISSERNLFESGITSLDAIRVNKLVREQMGVELEVTTLFEYPTIKSLASHLDEIVRAGRQQNVNV